MQEIYVKLPIWFILAVSCFLHIQHSFIPGRIHNCGTDATDSSVEMGAAAAPQNVS